MAPEKEKFSNHGDRSMHLPEGIQEIFTPGEADEAAAETSPPAAAEETSPPAAEEETSPPAAAEAETSPTAAARPPAAAAAVTVSKEEILQRAVEEEILQRAVESITGLVGSEPLMAPGSPKQIVEESIPARTSLSTATCVPSTATCSSAMASPAAAVPAEKLSLSLSLSQPTKDTNTSLSPTENVDLSLTLVAPATGLSTNPQRFTASDTLNLAASHPSASTSEASTTTVVCMDSLSRPSPSPWTMRARTPSLSSNQPLHLQVGMVRPGPPQERPSPTSSGLLLHDFRPAEMMSQYVPAHMEIPHCFHNLLSSVFVDNVPCAQKSLLSAMALSLENRQIPVLHGINLPPDQGLLPDDPFHMATFLYVGALFDEFEHHWETALQSRSAFQQQLSQEKEKLRLCQDQLQSLREVNSLLAKSNSPVEREQIIRLQQECRKSSQRLQEVTHDFQELKAFSVNLQQQLTTAEEQRTSASMEAQTSHEKLQVSAAELSRLKIKMISMVELRQGSPNEDQLKTTVDSMALEIAKTQQQLNEADVASKAALVRCEALEQEKIALEQEKIALTNSNAEKSLSLQDAEKNSNALKTTVTELTIQVKELSKERDAAAPFLSDAKLRAKSHQAEITSMQEEKKSLLQIVAARDDKITSLKGSVDTLTKGKKKASAETIKELERARETISSLNQDKSKLLRDTKTDSVNFLALKDNFDKQETRYEEALRVSNAQIASLKDAAQSHAAIKASLEEQLNVSANKVLDLTEQVTAAPVTEDEDGKKSYKKLKKKYESVLKLLQDQTSANDSADTSENELKAVAAVTPSPEPEVAKPNKKASAGRSYCEAAAAAPAEASPGSPSSPEDSLQMNIQPGDRFPDHSRKRDRSERRLSSSQRSRKKSRSGSSDRQVRYRGSPPRHEASPGPRDLSPEPSKARRSPQRRRSSSPHPQRGSQLHYDLDRMDEDLHTRAFTLIKQHTTESVEAISGDRNLIKFLRGPASNMEKSEKVKKLLQGYAMCTSLEDLTALNTGTPPPADTAFQPLPDFSPNSDEWKFVQSIVQNNFVHFPSLMGLYRLYCSKVYAFFHYGRKSDPQKKKDTISLLYTADKDNNNLKRSDWEKKLDLILVLVTGRLVFYTLDHISYFECNPDRSLYFSSTFLSEDFMEEMIACRSYSDPYLLSRRSMYYLYTECYGTKARRDFNHRIARYEPEEVSGQPTTFSWLNQ